MVFPKRDDFRQLATKGNLIPVYREIVADMITPVSAYLKLDTGGHTFLFESAEKGERFGRYSFIGADPSVFFSMTGNKLTITENGKKREITTDKDPLEELKALMSEYQPVQVEDLPIFYGGAVGFLTFEAVRHFEPSVGTAETNDLNLPDAYFFISDSILIFDHLTHRLKILINAHVQDNPEAAYDQAIAKINAIQEKLERPIPHRILSARQDVEIPDPDVNMTKDYYLRMTERMQENIRAGDIFQVVPSQRFSLPFDKDPIELYRALRFINPSPYMFCLKLGDMSVVGSSPEIHVRCEDGKVEIRPIAGTRPRRIDPEEDRAMERELLDNPKECAEHVMLVDLARNDVGRVCDFHSVQVTDFMSVERYSHVMHIVSHVEGMLKDGYCSYDVMRATFPAGTVSGSPKIRAMQIIAENEPTWRGVYSGAVGYFSFSGNLDSCIAIRTICIKDGKAYVQAGGGLVADSTPEGEYQESRQKAKACLKAIAQIQSLG